MMKTGMTSVTFRNKSAEEIVCLTHKAGLTGIEWGGDVHVPAGDRAAARKAALLTREAGLEVLSYGSYFRAGEEEDFSPILESAIELGAPMIRIWAGTKSCEDSSPEEFAALAGRIREAGKLAAAAGIQLGMEYHRGTATQTKEGAEALIKAINLPEVGCYWQPNPDISHSEQLAEIDLLLPFLQNMRCNPQKNRYKDLHSACLFLHKSFHNCQTSPAAAFRLRRAHRSRDALLLACAHPP